MSKTGKLITALVLVALTLSGCAPAPSDVTPGAGEESAPATPQPTITPEPTKTPEPVAVPTGHEGITLDLTALQDWRDANGPELDWREIEAAEFTQTLEDNGNLSDRQVAFVGGKAGFLDVTGQDCWLAVHQLPTTINVDGTPVNLGPDGVSDKVDGKRYFVNPLAILPYTVNDAGQREFRFDARTVRQAMILVDGELRIAYLGSDGTLHYEDSFVPHDPIELPENVVQVGFDETLSRYCMFDENGKIVQEYDLETGEWQAIFATEYLDREPTEWEQNPEIHAWTSGWMQLPTKEDGTTVNVQIMVSADPETTNPGLAAGLVFADPESISYLYDEEKGGFESKVPPEKLDSFVKQMIAGGNWAREGLGEMVRRALADIKRKSTDPESSDDWVNSGLAEWVEKASAEDGGVIFYFGGMKVSENNLVWDFDLPEEIMREQDRIGVIEHGTVHSGNRFHSRFYVVGYSPNGRPMLAVGDLRSRDFIGIGGSVANVIQIALMYLTPGYVLDPDSVGGVIQPVTVISGRGGSKNDAGDWGICRSKKVSYDGHTYGLTCLMALTGPMAGFSD